jgi:acylphosphatase
VKRFVVSGRVQGVGYRAFATRMARSLGLEGGARNLDDGRVEVIAAGQEHAVLRFESALHEGSRSARVDSVEIEELTAVPEGLSAGFDVEF